MSDIDDEFYEPPPRRKTGRVVVALVLVAGVGLLGWGAEKRYHFVDRLTRQVGAPSQEDPRVASLLGEGERALVSGDLDGAQAAFDKLSVLTDRDPRVLLGLARVAAAKADVPWLKLRLLPPDAADEIRVTKAELGELVATAQRTSQEAQAVHPDDPQVLRAKIDALRLAGETDAARSYVVAVFGQASQPETAYVLAALEMSQPLPPWPSVIDRLRLASAGEWSSGRVRAALVYALARSGDLAGARVEMAKLDASPRPHPCLANLRTLFVAPPVDAGTVAPASGGDGGVDAGGGRDAAAGALAQAGRWQAGQGEGESDPSDNPAAATLLAASQALATHDFSRAERIYQAILTSEPRDSQALSGLGDVDRERGDWQGAISYYRRALSVNPSYLPALLGLADTQWFHGDRSAALSVYKNIEEHYPEGTYPEYVKQRASGAQ